MSGLRVGLVEGSIERLRPAEHSTVGKVTTGRGYADQVHLVRDFRFAIGQIPAAYAASQSSG